MPELRWILIACGVVLLVGIYVWGRRNSKATASSGVEDAIARRPEPVFETADAYDPPIVQAEDAFDDAVEADYAESEGAPAPVVARSHVRASIDESNDPTLEAPVGRADRERRYARIEPTFIDESMTAELPAEDIPEPPARPAPPAPSPSAAPSASQSPAADAPTLSMSTSPPPRRIERRKIIALRLATPQRIPGAQLRAALESESLAHGKYGVFHRLDEESGGALFSVASMVEPGTFDLEKMPQESYPGITLFAQLPGPVAGMLALNELIACSRRLHSALGGTLQDERGVPLTVHRIERIRQEIREFEHRPTTDSAHRPSSTLSPSP